MLNYSYLIKTVAVSTSLISLITVNKATAQVVGEITVDPYNDSSFQTTPINLNTPKAEDIPNTVYINAPATPPRPTQIQGELTSSDQSLPAIPPISEPYSKQPHNNNTSIDPTNSSISISPYDVSPNDDNRVIKQNTTLNQQTSPHQPKTINVSPVNSANPVKKSSNNDQYQRKLPPQPTTKSRRTLRDILVQSNSSQQTNTAPKNNNISTLSNNNQKVYKVLVKANTMAEKQQIKSLYPEAFTKKIQGNSFLQIGIFTTQESVEQVSQSLAQIGFKAVVMQ